MSSFLMWHKVFCNCLRITYALDFCSHSFSHHSISSAKFNATQQARLAQKYLIKDKDIWKKKLKKTITNSGQQKMLVSSTFGVAKEQNDFRLRRFNVVFMEKVTEVLSTSEYYSEILEKGFEITRIRVQPGFSVVHVYWYSKFEYQDELGDFVSALSKYIRYELSSQRILGRVPPFLFIRDDSVHVVAEIDRRLKIADFGPDYKPIHFKPEISQAVPLIQKELSSQTWESLDEKSQAIETKELPPDPLDAEQQFPSDILTIRTDIFGVKREKIMNMVKKGCKTSNGSYKTIEELQCFSLSQADLNSQVNHIHYAHSGHARTIEIKKWVMKHKRLSKRKIKMEERNKLNNLNIQDDVEEDEGETWHLDWESDEADERELDYSDDFDDCKSYDSNKNQDVFNDK